MDALPSIDSNVIMMEHLDSDSSEVRSIGGARHKVTDVASKNDPAAHRYQGMSKGEHVKSMCTIVQTRMSNRKWVCLFEYCSCFYDVHATRVS